MEAIIAQDKWAEGNRAGSETIFCSNATLSISATEETHRMTTGVWNAVRLLIVQRRVTSQRSVGALTFGWTLSRFESTDWLGGRYPWHDVLGTLN